VNRDEKPKPKQFFYISSAFLLALSISFVYASVFVYYPTSMNVQGVRPPVIFQPVPGVPATISPWGTYASVSIVLPLIVENANFSETLDPWSTYTNIDEATWSAESNLEALDGYVARFSETTGDRDRTGYGEVYHDISVPSLAGADRYTVIVYIRFRISQLRRGSISITYGLFDSATNSWICSKSYTYRRVTDWIPDSVVCNINVASSYRLRAYISINNVVNFIVDIDYLYVSVYSFGGAVLNVFNQDSQPYYAKLTLDSVAGLNPQSLYCEISLGGSQPIQIRVGQIVASETLPEVVLSTNSSTSINVKCLVTSSGSYALNLTLRYCTLSGGGGACVFYPLTITLTAG